MSLESKLIEIPKTIKMCPQRIKIKRTEYFLNFAVSLSLHLKNLPSPAPVIVEDF